MNPGTKQLGTTVTGFFLFFMFCACIGYIIFQVVSGTSPSPGPSPSAVSAPSSGTRQCAQSPASVFSSSPSSSTFSITAPSGGVISSIDYANFGNASGLCGAYTDGSCQLYPDSSVMSLIRSACVNNTTCTIPLSTQTFGSLDTSVDTSCSTTPTYLTVQYKTTTVPSPSPNSPTPTPSPSHP